MSGPNAEGTTSDEYGAWQHSVGGTCGHGYRTVAHDPVTGEPVDSAPVQAVLTLRDKDERVWRAVVELGNVLDDEDRMWVMGAASMERLGFSLTSFTVVLPEPPPPPPQVR